MVAGPFKVGGNAGGCAAVVGCAENPFELAPKESNLFENHISEVSRLNGNDSGVTTGVHSLLQKIGTHRSIHQTNLQGLRTKGAIKLLPSFFNKNRDCC